MTAVATDDVERTARDTTIAQWCVAGVVMLGSMAAGGFAFHYLGESWPLGVLIALAVDLALAAWLRIESRLRAHGVHSGWGRVLEVVTALMTLYLNLGAAAFRSIDQHSTAARVLLGIAHCFLPIVLVLITVAGGQAQLRLTQVKRDRETRERSDRDVQLAADRAESQRQQAERQDIERRRANGELVDAEDAHHKAQELRQQAQRDADEAAHLREVAQREREAAEAEITVTRAAAEKLAQRPHKPATNGAARKRGSGKPASPEVRRQWIREQRAAGHNPTGSDVDREFGPPKTGYRLVRHVEEEIDAELTKVAGGAN